MSARFKTLSLIFVSACLFVAPHHFPHLWPLAFFGLVPYFFSMNGRSTGSLFKYSFVFGLFFNLMMGYWLSLVNGLGYLLLSVYLALYFAVFGALSRAFLYPDQDFALYDLKRALRSLVFVPAFWVSLEWIRSWMISGLPWALTGYGQWQNLVLIQIADVIGVYGISFLVIFVNVAFFQTLRIWRQKPLGRAHQMADNNTSRFQKVSMLIGVLGAVMGFTFLYGTLVLSARDRFYQNADKKAVLRVSVLQGNIPQDQKWDKRIKAIIFEKYKNLMFMSALEQSDLIIWPETSFPGYLEDEPVMAAELRSAVRQAHTQVLVGAPTIGALEEGIHFFNSAVFYSPSGEEAGRYHKLHLVPFGEYVPLETLIGFLRNMVAVGHFTPGTQHTLFTVFSRYQELKVKVKFGTLICFEDIFPGLVREFKRKGADFLVNITNDAWFGKTSAPYQHASASVLRAVENRVNVIRAANTGYSCVISPEGRVLAFVEDGGEAINVTGHKSQNIVLRKETSFYTRFGDIFTYLCLLASFLAVRIRMKEHTDSV